jgi:hypothetical protein
MTSKTTTKTTAAATDRLPDESDATFVRRMTKLATAASIAAAETAVLTSDDVARLATFEDRVSRSVLAGLALIGRATLALGSAPADYAAASKAVNVTADGGEYLGRKYSTLRECYRLATSHTDEAAESFVAAYRAANDGKAPEQIRDYVKWTTAADRFKTVDTLVKRKTTAAESAVAARAAADDRRKLAVKLTAAGKVTGCKLTAADWSSMSADTLAQVAILADALAVKRRAETRKATAAATAATAAAETGPTPRRTRRKAAAAS